MAKGVYVPIWGMQMTEATVSDWLVAEGRPVSRGQGVVIIETYKISGEVESPEDGILRRQTAGPGEVLPVGSLLGVIGSSEEDDAEIDRVIREESMVTDLEVTEPQHTGKRAPAETQPPSVAPAPVATESSNVQKGSGVRATPRAKRLAREKGIDLTKVKGSGKGGRVQAQDVETYRAAPSVAAPPPAADEIVPLTPLRRAIIAKTMQTVDIPYGALSRNVQVEKLLAFRASLAEAFERRHGYKLTLTHLLFKAAALALDEVPILNSHLEGDNIVVHGAKNIGMVVTPPGGGGIMIPVLRDLQAKDLSTISQEWAAMVERINSGTQTMEDLTGGTFTISNVGALGIDVFTPLIHPPESAILGLSRIVETPVVEDGQIVPGKTTILIIGADHRVFDADPIGTFLTTLDRLFQNPEELLL